MDLPSRNKTNTENELALKSDLKIVVLLIPFWGHLNPISGIINELITKYKANVIFYGNVENKQLIESTGATFRLYSYFPTVEYMLKIAQDNNDDIIETLDALYYIDVTNRILPELVNMIEVDKPDLILSEPMGVHVKYLKKYLTNKSFRKMPSFINFFTTFPIIPNIYPNKVEEELSVRPAFSLKRTFKIVYYSVKAYIKQIFFCWKFGFSFTSPFTILDQVESCDLNLVSIMAELQPRYHLFDKTYKFVGSTINESLRNKAQIKSNENMSIINTYDVINPLLLEDGYYLKLNSDKSINKLLIYASLGTVFNNDFNLMFKIVNAFKHLLNEPNYNSLEFLVSCGKDVFQKFEHKINNGQFVLPKNITLCKSAPQIEILKRASLFLTHAGMNSISEAIHYGVPLVCLPIDFDQPGVAYRVCDELGFGIRLNKDESNLSEQIKQAVINVISNRDYQERILRFSQISRRYNGCLHSAELINDFISAKKNKND